MGKKRGRPKTRASNKRGPGLNVRAEKEDQLRIFADLKQVEGIGGKDRSDIVFDAIDQYVKKNYGEIAVDRFIEKSLQISDSLDDTKQAGISFNVTEDEKRKLARGPASISDLIELENPNPDDRLRIYGDIYRKWVCFQNEVVNILLSGKYGMSTHYFDYWTQKHSEIDPKDVKGIFQGAIERKFVEGHPSKVEFHWLVKQIERNYKREIYSYLRSEKIFSNMENAEIDIDRFKQFLPEIVDILPGYKDAYKTDQQTQEEFQKLEDEYEDEAKDEGEDKKPLFPHEPEDIYEGPGGPLFRFGYFYWMVTGRLSEGDFQSEKANNPACRQAYKKLFDLVLRERRVPLFPEEENRGGKMQVFFVPEEEGVRIKLKISKTLENLFDLDGFYNYLWDNGQIFGFLESICCYRAIGYFGEYMHRARESLVLNLHSFNKVCEDLNHLYAFLGRWQKIQGGRKHPLSDDLDQALKKLITGHFETRELLLKGHSVTRLEMMDQFPNSIKKMWEEFLKLGLIRAVLPKDEKKE